MAVVAFEGPLHRLKAFNFGRSISTAKKHVVADASLCKIVVEA